MTWTFFDRFVRFRPRRELYNNAISLSICLSVSGGNKQRHTGDPAVHGLCVRSVKQRARSPASHLQTSERLRASELTDLQTPQRLLLDAAQTPEGVPRTRRAQDSSTTAPRHKQRICWNGKSECHDI